MPYSEEYLARLYAKCKQEVDECLAANEIVDGILTLPFQCYLCLERRMDFSFFSGDGCPICHKCVPIPEDCRAFSPAPAEGG